MPSPSMPEKRGGNIRRLRSAAHSHFIPPSFFPFFLVCNLTTLMCARLSGRGREKKRKPSSFQRPQTGKEMFEDKPNGGRQSLTMKGKLFFI